ncbi:MAG: DUF3540 domain-containing protein [Pseudomonadota bacterium]
MTPIVRHPAPPAAALAPQWSEAGIAVALDEQRFLLDDGRMVRQALSCVLAPEVGDKVLVAACANGEVFIVHLLLRQDPALARLCVPGARELRIEQARIALQANEEIALKSLRDIEITAATGLLALNADNLYSTVNECVVQTMRQYVGRAEQYLLDVSALLRLHGQHALLLADQDVKVDAERVSLG